MKATNRRFTGTFEDYKAYVALYLEITGAAVAYDEEIIAAAWERQEDGIAAAIACKVEYDAGNT